MITSESSDQLLARPPKRKMHPNSLANLKPPYKPGENGHGRVYPLKERLRHQLDHPLVEPKDNAPAGERLVYATLKGAIDLVPTAFNQTWDRVEGKVPEPSRPMPEGYQDNRVLNIVVLNTETKELIGKLAGWTQKPPVGVPDGS